MTTSDAVGGRPEQSRPEETHRPTANLPAYLLHTARRLSQSRLRLQLAGMAALAIVALLGFVLLPPRTVRIEADGAVSTVNSRAASDTVVVEQAGIELEPGDLVEPLDDGTLAVRRAKEARLQVDGQAFFLRTQADTIAELLVEADAELGPQDSILRNGLFVSPAAPVAIPPRLATIAQARVGHGRPTDEPVTITVRRAVPFAVVEDAQPFELRSSRETLATALRDVGIRIGPGDKVQPPLSTELTAGVEVHIEHATPVIVTAPEGKLVLYSLASTIDDALTQGGVKLPARYRLEPPSGTPVTAGLVVHVVGISESREIEEERIESQTVYEPDTSLPWGQRRVVAGQDGMHLRQFRVVYEDGRVVSRELVREWFDPEPMNTVIYYSTASEPQAPAVPAGVPDGLDAAQVLRVYATWYNAASAGRPPSDPLYGITATGVRVDRGIIAVDPSVIPLGTRMYIPGYGYGIAADTGGGINGNMIDLGYPDGVVPDWTTHWVDIYILGP